MKINWRRFSLKEKLTHKEQRRERYDRKQYKGKPVKANKNFKRLKTEELKDKEFKEELKDL